MKNKRYCVKTKLFYFLSLFRWFLVKGRENRFLSNQVKTDTDTPPVGPLNKEMNGQMDRRTDVLKRQLVRWKSWKQIEKYPHIFGKTCNIPFRCLLYINFKRDFVYLFLFFSWRLYIFLRSFISMLTTTEIVSLANLYRSGSCFSLYVLILSLILSSFTRARILGIHRLRFIFAYSHSRADCMFRIKLFWWRCLFKKLFSSI